MLQDMELVEDHLRLRQHARHCVQIGAMHVGAGRFHCGALPRIKARGQQPGQTLLGAVFRQSDHFGMHEIRQHGVELLGFASMDLVRSKVAWPALRPSVIPFRQERMLRAPRFAPTDTVPYLSRASRPPSRQPLPLRRAQTVGSQ
jgi:hypothetical protein